MNKFTKNSSWSGVMLKDAVVGFVSIQTVCYLL